MLVSDKGEIRWMYLVDLLKLQEKIGFQLANKLSRAHLNFLNNKMKVRFAVQTLSSSVADSLEALKKLKQEKFQDCNATVEFIRIIDRIFDFLNSRNPYGKGYKRPIRVHELPYFEKRIDEWCKYLYSLKTANGKPVFKSRRSTFVVGLTFALKSVFAVSVRLLEMPFYKYVIISLFIFLLLPMNLLSCRFLPLRYVLTYKFSQDHLELLFGVIRLRLGCNDNPNVMQFRTSMKKILLKNDLKPSAAGNCILFEPPAGGIFDITLRRRIARRKKEPPIQDVSWEDEFKDLPNNGNFDRCTDIFLRDNILYYISGFIAMKLSDRITCQNCCQALFKNQDHDYAYTAKSHEFFARFKNRGGLKMASEDVYSVVRETERQLCPFYSNLSELNAAHIIQRVKNKVALDCHSFGRDCVEDDFFRPHNLLLIHNISSLYIQIKMYSITRMFSLELRMSIRNKLKKTVDFQNL